MVRVSEQLLSASRVSTLGAARLGAMGIGMSSFMTATNGTITHPDPRGA